MAVRRLMRLWISAAWVATVVRAVRRWPGGVAAETAAPVHPETAIEPGWKGFVADFRVGMKNDRLSVVAGSLAYYSLLSLIPALVALVSIYGLAFDAADVERQIADVADVLPDEAEQLIVVQLRAVVDSNSAGLGVGLVVGLAAALWSASNGVKALIDTINLVFDEPETRSFLVLRGVSLAFTFGAILLAAAGLGALVVLPSVLPVGGVGRTAISLALWPASVLVVAAGLAILYRWGPARSQPSWDWVRWGALGAAAGWALVTVLFGLYTSTFGNFSATYGALAGVILLLLWFYLSGLVVLLGAEANAVHVQRRAARRA